MQDWAGIAIDVDEITRSVGPLHPQGNEIIPCYNVAIKGDPLGNSYILNATLPAAVEELEKRRGSVNEITERLKAELKAENQSGAVVQKVKNTLTYLNWCATMGAVGW
jgi:hypothetical protein